MCLLSYREWKKRPTSSQKHQRRVGCSAQVNLSWLVLVRSDASGLGGGFCIPSKIILCTRRNWLMLIGILFRELFSMFACHSARLTLRLEDLRTARRSELPYIIYHIYIEFPLELPQLLVLELPYSYIHIYMVIYEYSYSAIKTCEGVFGNVRCISI